ncbi:hypothetical protein CgunFtcFv8_007600 [Champsocephalus gunnari]|uniref:Uncharacterized protein n=1 Tax=Champsocephalus gunnari TaxID=52237 RepID=A0AAN8CK20_CHAGU|nr:hypothetical protein CgunFtcFv8_007600 [Champsocephalus gunnari]
MDIIYNQNDNLIQTERDRGSEDGLKRRMGDESVRCWEAATPPKVGAGPAAETLPYEIKRSEWRRLQGHGSSPGVLRKGAGLIMMKTTGTTMIDDGRRSYSCIALHCAYLNRT